ncbi:MAG TPA: DUF3291 domain-containing protein [Ktedonobacterales bacterium]|jgi:hypothetical protein|nr:DUF3291 domain-containing protein [Ktedonobacterales bacterium]HEX5572860.1 DUF3291 domain-containing protein [Ktedonobacterales bacterium]
MARVAFFTFGVLREPRGHPQTRGFEDRIAASFAEASASPGFICYPQQMRVEPDDLGVIWPAAKGPEREAMMTLSLWESLEAVFAYSYHLRGVHNEALKLRKEWFVEPEWPNYVAWWVADDHLPTWQEAVERHQLLSERGPTADAFDFHAPFDAEGRPTRILRRPIALGPASLG